MKLTDHRAIVIGTLLLIPVLALQAQDKPLETKTQTFTPGVYLQGEAGAVFMQDLQVNVGSREKLSFNPGVRGDLVLGYKFNQSWSTELDCGVLWNSFNKYGNYSFPSNEQAELYQIPILVNYLYRLPIKGSFEGFLGGGVGAVVSKFHLNDQGLDFKNSDLTFGGQVMAGVKYHLSSQADLGLAYKFLGTTSHKWADQGWYTQTSGSLTHALVLALSVKY
jgi:opacity protein-like surface antigen